MNLRDNRVLVMWTALCVIGGILGSLAFGILGQLLTGG